MAKEFNVYFSYENEDQYKKIIKHTNTLFSNYTVLTGTGCYEGVNEPCVIIRIIDLESVSRISHVEFFVETLAEYIKIVANQECVLITKTNIGGKLI